MTTTIQPATDEQVEDWKTSLDYFLNGLEILSLIARIEADREQKARLQDAVDAYRSEPRLYTHADIAQAVARADAAEAREKALTEALTDARSYIVDERDRFVRAVCSNPPTPEESEHLAGIAASLARVDAALSQAKGEQA